MLLALCICKASEPADIVFYFKGLVTQQMREDNDKQYSNLGHAKQVANPHYKLFICLLYSNLVICGEFFGLILYAFVIMPSHIHLIARTKHRFKLEDTIRDFKKYTSKKLIKTILEFPESRNEWLINNFSFAARRIKKGVNYKVWKHGFLPVELNSTSMIKQRLNYIHNNPVEDEIVFEPEEYKYSSAGIYAGRIGVLEIEKL